MSDRFKFRIGFTISFYDIAGNDVERQIILDSCFSIDNGGEGICVHKSIIQDALDIYIAEDEQKTAWDFINANYAETDDYYFIDSVDFLEQCTGLKDKKGKLIYEGDILKIIQNEWVKNKKYKSFWTVEYKNFSGELGFRVYGVNRRFNIRLSENVVYNSQAVVVGNIHENGDLLK